MTSEEDQRPSSPGQIGWCGWSIELTWGIYRGFILGRRSWCILKRIRYVKIDRKVEGGSD